MKDLLFKVVILLVLTVPSFISLVRPGFFPMQDDLQAFRIHQMDQCFQDWQIPCRWVPDPGYQYGYPQFNFYPPSVYYLGEVIHLLGFQIIDAVKILFILGYVISALTMFILLRLFVKDWNAVVGALIYTYIPYKATEVYVRGALSEFWALVIFPLLFWSSYQLIKTGKLKYLIWLGLSTGLLLTTHNLMSMIFLPLVGVWSLTWIYLLKSWRNLGKLILGGLLGLGLAAFFTLPVIFEGKYAHIESLLGGYFDYRQHFVDVDQLFINNHWGYGSSYLGPNDDLNLSVGQFYMLTAVLGLILSYVLYKQQQQTSTIYLVVFTLELLVLFLMHQKSSFIWDKIPLLSWLQFPWRFLADSVLLITLLCGLTLKFLEKWDLKIHIGKLGLSTIVGVFILGSSFFWYQNFYQPREWFDLDDSQKFSGNLWEKQLTISIFDYLPIYAKLPPIKKAPQFPEVLEGEVNFISYKKGSNFQVAEVDSKQDSLIRLPLFDFPGMKVKIDNQEVKHVNNDCRGEEFCLGLITVNVPVGQHKFEVQLTNTLVRNIGNGLTLISLGLLILATIKINSKK